jgi:hypothetical protein
MRTINLIILLLTTALFAQTDPLEILNRAQNLYKSQQYSEAVELVADLTNDSTYSAQIQANAFLILGASNIELGSITIGKNAFRLALCIYPQLSFDPSRFSKIAQRYYSQVYQELVWKIHITSVPNGSEVILHDQVYGATPVNVFLVRGEKYRIKISNEPKYKPRVVTLDLTGDIDEQQSGVHIELSRRKGGLSVVSVPSEASITFNSVAAGVTPFRIDSLEYNRYEIQLTFHNLNPYHAVVNIDSSVNYLKVKLKQGTGFLLLRHYPPVAKVRIQKGLAKNSISPNLIEMPIGRFNYEISAPGYSKYQENFNIALQDTTYCFARLGTASHFFRTLLGLLILSGVGGGLYYYKFYQE